VRSAQRERIPVRISPDFLDTIGRSFKFKHAKGVAEWLKNSLDQYLRLRERGLESRSGAWPVVILLQDGSTSKTGPNLAVIDFGGTTLSSIDDFFLEWGSRSAATLGGTATASVTGGHGNGGKFYMREMWKDGARLLTWRDGKASSLIVDKKEGGTTGEWELKNAPMGWRDALSQGLAARDGGAGYDGVLRSLAEHDPALIQELDGMTRGLTVLLGMRAVQVYSSNDVVRGGKWDHQRLVDDLRDAPQARRPIRELSISVLVNGQEALLRLVPDAIEDDPDWPQSELPIPAGVIGLDDATESIGLLRLRKSAQQLVGRLRHRNTIWVMDGKGNPIAFYPIGELPLAGASSLLSFIHGELHLTFAGVDALLQNDRERLVTSQTTESLLGWLAEEVWKRVKTAEDAQREVRHRSELEVAAILNDSLNQHAKRFLQELQTQIMVDVIDWDADGGGPGRVGTGAGGRGGEGSGKGREEGAGGGESTGGSREVPGTAQPSRRPQFPQVLLSDIDADPSRSDGRSKPLTDRHPPLEQDDVDKRHNVWWINTTHPFAVEALRLGGGAKGHAFRSHQLCMFRDVVQREGLRYLQRREAELGLDIVENELSEISNRFLAELPRDLVRELLG
jgi:hypothetical protein